MQKAIEGGIYFCKVNWLENYQNTLYQNRWDIDSTNGSALYTHQYMQNLMGAYSEAKTLYSMYNNTGKINSKFTFIIPLYEEMDSSISSLPSDNTEAYPINVEIVGTNVRLRNEANTNSEIIKEFENAGEILLSVERGINSDMVLPPNSILVPAVQRRTEFYKYSILLYRVCRIRARKRCDGLSVSFPRGKPVFPLTNLLPCTTISTEYKV